MKIRLSGELIKDGADNKGNMVSEGEEGTASVEEWWGVDEREKKEHSFKELRKNNVFEAILFSTQYIIKENPNTGATISCFVCWQVPAFPICQAARTAAALSYRVIQEESALLWEMIVWVILSKKVHMNMGPILNG